MAIRQQKPDQRHTAKYYTHAHTDQDKSEEKLLSINKAIQVIKELGFFVCFCFCFFLPLCGTDSYNKNLRPTNLKQNNARLSCLVGKTELAATITTTINN